MSRIKNVGFKVVGKDKINYYQMKYEELKQFKKDKFPGVQLSHILYYIMLLGIDKIQEGNNMEILEQVIKVNGGKLNE